MGPSIKLLCVENHGPLARLIQEVLEKEPGLAVVGQAESICAALELLDELWPDVVILELHLPDMCALEAIPLFRQRAPQVRVILLTDHDDPRYDQAAADRGAVGCVRKDLLATHLAPIVKNIP